MAEPGNDHDPATCACRPALDGLTELPSDAMVVRFRPTAAEDVLRWAGKSHRAMFDPARVERTFYRISVFADVKRPGEDDEALLQRLIRAAGLDGLNLGKNKHCWIARSGDLQGLDVPFCKDGYEGEPEEHYSLDLGSHPTVGDVERVLSVFVGPERTQR